MRILNITAQKPFDTGSGIYLSELLKGFKNRGHTNSLICGITQSDLDNFNEDSYRICTDNNSYIKSDDKITVYPTIFEEDKLPFPVCGMSDSMPYKSTRYSDMSCQMEEQWDSAFIEQVKKAVSIENPDVIICHHLYRLTALVTKYIKDIPVYAICHGSDLRQLRSNASCRNDIIKGVRRLSGIFCLHQNQRDEISEIYGIPSKYIHIVGVGFNNSIFNYNGEKKEKRIVFAGKISEKKGVHSLLRATAQLDDPEITISLAGSVGKEEELNTIKNIAKNHPLRVDFSGKLMQNELASLMRHSKVFVLPSFFEGLPLVTLEASACGCNTVMTDLPGIQSWYNQFVPDNHTLFVQPPVMAQIDTPAEVSLPYFEERLCNAIKTALAMDTSLPDLSNVSWQSVSDRVLETVLTTGLNKY